MGSRVASYVSGTAEDQPPSPGAWLGSSRTNYFQYSGDLRPTQLIKRLREASHPLFLRGRASLPAWRRWFCENNLRNVPAATKEAGGGTSQGRYGAGNGMRPNRRSPDSGS